MSEGLSREDLFMFMELYRNTSTANTTLLEQQKTLLEKQNSLLEKIGSANDTMETVSENLKVTMEKMSTFQQDCVTNQVEVKGNASLEHSKLTNKIYVTYGILGGIVLALISMIMQLTDKLEVVEAIAKATGVN